MTIPARKLRLPVFILPGLLCLLPAIFVQPAQAQQRLRQWVAQHMEQRQEKHPAKLPALPPGSRTELDIAYGAAPGQRYDVYLPARPGPNTPIIFMVHGGGWALGDKRMPQVVENKANYWLNKGDIFISANNRLVPEADPLQQARDIALAVASAQQHATRWNADPKRLILMGHSAGAHLVALLGSKPEMLKEAGAQRPMGVVSLDSGALDVPALMAQPRLPGFYRDAFGSDPSYWQAASPQQQLENAALPMLLVCSSIRHFPTSPCDEAGKFAQRAKTLGIPMEILPQAQKHEEINEQLGLPSAYTQAVSGWIDRQLNLSR